MHDLKQYRDKLFKADYISLRLKFMHQLKYLSISLKDPALKVQAAGQSKKVFRELK